MRMSTDGSGTSSFQPLLGQLPPERIHPAAAFVDWWNDPVLTDADGTSYNRRSLVLWVTNKEGGAHVDEDLPSSYVALTRENSIGITQVPVPHVNGAGLGFSIAPTATGITPPAPRWSATGELVCPREHTSDRLGAARHHSSASRVSCAWCLHPSANLVPSAFQTRVRDLTVTLLARAGVDARLSAASGCDCLAARSHFRSSGHEVRRRAEPVYGQHRMAPVR